MSGKPTPSRKHQVWERDGWTCLVPRCWHPEEDGGRAIDPALAGTDGDWSPTVDHIVMRCDGGWLCLLCGDRGGGTVDVTTTGNYL